MLSNLLLASSYNPFKKINPGTSQGVLIIIGITFGLAIIALGLYLAISRKDEYLKGIIVSIFMFSIAYAIAAFSVEVSNEHGDVTAVSIIFGVLVVLLSLFISIASRKFGVNDKQFKKVLMAFSIVLIVLSLSLFITSIVLSPKHFAYAEDAKLKQNITLAIICVVTFILAYQTFQKTISKVAMDTKFIAHAAICLALSFALSYVKIFRLPQGGSITLASILPLAVFAYIYGFKRALPITLIYGVMQSMQDPWVIHPVQYIMDYPLAFASIALAGALTNVKKMDMRLKFAFGIIFVAFARYIIHAISGTYYFYTYGGSGATPSTYAATSFIYNSFVFADGLIALLAGVILLSHKQMRMVIQLNSNRLSIKDNDIE